METLTKADITARAGYASDELREEILSKLTNDMDKTYHCAYTDYGGDFLDKVFIEYFKECYPDNIVYETTSWSGQNAFIFGNIGDTTIQAFIDLTGDYLLGFDTLEDFHSEMEMKEFDAFVELVVTDCLTGYEFDKDTVISWLREEKYGYYSILTTGIDFSEADLLEELEQAGIIVKQT